MSTSRAFVRPTPLLRNFLIAAGVLSLVIFSFLMPVKNASGADTTTVTSISIGVTTNTTTFVIPGITMDQFILLVIGVIVIIAIVAVASIASSRSDSNTSSRTVVVEKQSP